MATTSLAQSSGDDVFARISYALQMRGYIVLNDVFTIEQLQSLFIDIKQSDSDYFHQAGVGRELVHQVNPFVRRDRIRWLDMSHQPTQFYLQWAERLRLYLNRKLFLGLFDYECMYAHYPKGAFYKKHLDAFKGNSSRRLTSILYLNPAWQPADGGELVMYAADDSRVVETVAPTFGTMAIFLSNEFPHEVLPTRCSRYSLTGWFRLNATTADNLDPPK